MTARSTWKHLTQGATQEGKENPGRLRASPRPGSAGSWQRTVSPGTSGGVQGAVQSSRGQAPQGLNSFGGLKGRHRATTLSFAALAPGLSRTHQEKGPGTTSDTEPPQKALLTNWAMLLALLSNRSVRRHFLDAPVSSC